MASKKLTVEALPIVSLNRTRLCINANISINVFLKLFLKDGLLLQDILLIADEPH